MGACCGLAGRGLGRGRSHYRVHKTGRSAAEPLLRENEREAVSNLLKYLEEGNLLNPHS